MGSQVVASRASSHHGFVLMLPQIELRLFGVPESEKTMICSFPTIQAAVDTCATVMQMGIPVARMELMDESTVEAINRYSKLNNKVQPSLIIEHHGSPNEIEEQSAIVQEIARDFEAEDIALATDPEERKKLWHGRHSAWYATIVSLHLCVMRLLFLAGRGLLTGVSLLSDAYAG
jgi:D-lactate dehydrogenase (cytochrome)